MDAAEFLFPSDLEVTPTPWKKILAIGSCLSERYVDFIKRTKPDLALEHVLFNNVADMPEKDQREIETFDLQYVQLPLRSVLTDAIIRIADVSPSIDWVEVGKQNIDLFLQSATKYNELCGILTIVSTFIVPQGHVAPSIIEENTRLDLATVVRELNAHIYRWVATRQNIVVADVDAVASSVGKRHFLDDPIYFFTHGGIIDHSWATLERTPSWSAPDPGRFEEVPDLSTIYENREAEFLAAVVRQMESLFRIAKQLDSVKAVIFDLDNTLWRGQLVEHYVDARSWPFADGWPMGLWETVHHLRRRGILVSIASKNDHELVSGRWHDAVQQGFLSFSDFLVPHINWEAKAQNIASILSKLSLTPRSAVFVDDHPVERASVKAALPDIRAIGSNPFDIRRILLWAAETQIARRSNESASRESMVKGQIEREGQRETMSREQFLVQLDSRVRLWELNEDDPSFARVFELVNKTNQFNTNGRRWDWNEMRRHVYENGRIFAFSASDRFSNYGTVGAAITSGNEILQFVMSCRVLGVEIEAAVIGAIVEELRGDSAGCEIHGTIVDTKTNRPCRLLYSSAGFAQASPGRFVLAQNSKARTVSHVSLEFSRSSATEGVD